MALLARRCRGRRCSSSAPCSRRTSKQKPPQRGHDPARRPERLGGAAPGRRGRRLPPATRRRTRARSRDAPLAAHAARRRRRACSRSGPTAPAFTLRTPTGAAGQPRVAARQGGAARALRHLVPALRRRGAAPEGDRTRSSRKTRYAFVAVNADGEDAASILAYHIYFGLPFPALARPEPVRSRQLPPRGLARAGLEGVQGASSSRPST